MLNQNELDLAIDLLCGTAEAMGVTLSPNAAAIMAVDLSEHPLGLIERALKACRKEVRGKLTMSDILSRIEAADGRPDKDEAWAIALASNDEFDTAVMTDEIQIALGAARPVLSLGDKVGARMAFINAYERLVSRARAETKSVNWHVSIGFDANRRIEAINAAVQMQRIPQERGRLYLADLSHEPITEDGRALAGLITGQVVKPTAAIREKLKGIKASMLEMRGVSDERKKEAREKAEQEFAARRAFLSQQAIAALAKEDAHV
ncbi:hypothetical protein QN400_10605 [Pseudomonas sp. RTC3]|uniref:hypothetical protein n=1 Tax=Pseudomonas sp. 5C2 TaxID=3048588 RepID=UPI002AB379B4|nr:hypothetical protein [Pseudomonas sp. 5C2]MDY7565808.1 hypothetical protein [Pseudomonas sp. 5C2]MEB0062477.1 hypothetical protein [Pseudomonas sp. RTC3]MEB0240482.1 hypothetical protein [Pseudomonas sp. 5C2]